LDQKNNFHLTVEIISADISNFNELRDIGMQTFIETFASVNTEDNMQSYLSENFAEGKLSEEINDPDADFYIARNDDGKTIGYLKLNFNAAQTELKEKDGVEIERIYTLKEYHGKKIGQQLLEKAFTLAREKSAEYIWLGVWQKNARAIAFYTKNGFVPFDTHSFRLGNDVQTDIMMKALL
jgi:diamine N-acetyltransferase